MKMTKIIETYKSYGKLFSRDFGKEFILLKPLPNVHSVPMPLRDAGYLEWFVLDETTGEGKNILLNGACLIEPYFEEVDVDVALTVEENSSTEV